MTWEPVCELGFKSTGFMRTSGSIRQAWACRTWARPISPPLLVTKELSDMFWALNGATQSPSCRKIRHRAAVRTDLPALDERPCSMMAGVLRTDWLRGLPDPKISERACTKRPFSSALRTATRK
jgi:hypothetical protein